VPGFQGSNGASVALARAHVCGESVEAQAILGKRQSDDDSINCTWTFRFRRRSFKATVVVVGNNGLPIWNCRFSRGSSSFTV
jgi:hypothetical protein